MNSRNNFDNAQEKEIINYLDENQKVIGSIERKKAIETGALLQAVQLWIINPKTKQVLMQKRAIKSKNDAGMIDVSTSGHIKEGETPIQAVLREALEEINLPREILFSKLQTIRQIEVDFTKLGRKGKYVTYEYLAYLDYPLGFYKKQDEEVDDLFFMSYEELKEKIRDKDKNMRIPYLEQTECLFKDIDKNLENITNKQLEKE